MNFFTLQEVGEDEVRYNVYFDFCSIVRCTLTLFIGKPECISASIYRLLAADHLGILQIISAHICKNDCHAFVQTDYNNIGELKIEISFEIRGLGRFLGQKHF